ncbi:family S53 protease-like protein [Lenzites betulinus]|nr:family S53 protease-like protein [Lenzites betulinus]
MVAAGLLFFAAFSFALGRPTSPDELRIHDRRSDAPPGFKYLGQAHPDTVLNLRIALPQSDPAGLEAALYDVSTPSSTNYRKHLSKAEAQGFLAPKPESVQAVKAWLSKNNVSVAKTSSIGDWMTINVPVSQANVLLGTQFGEYAHEETNTKMIRTLAYSVPASVKDHVDVVYPATSFIEPQGLSAAVRVYKPLAGRASKKATQGKGKGSRTSSSAKPSPTAVAAVADSCRTVITPKCLQAIYNMPSTPASGNRSTLFVTGFGGESATPSDLKTFLGQFRPDYKVASTNFTVQTADGGSANFVTATAEASLDIQYTVGVATDIPTTFLSVGSNNTDGAAGFLDIIDNFLAQDEVPFVLTTSFGFNENQVPLALGRQTHRSRRNLCNAYAQLGARGTTVLFGAGDGGVSGIQTNKGCTSFVPTFPSTCPFVTSVGGTTGFNPEVAVTFSSGGFSNMFPRPSYQSNAVDSYLKTLGNTNAGLFNTSGRGFPDIAAQAQGFQVVVNGQVKPVAGTSAASPTVASLVALLNDALFEEGHAPVGFLNPFLYSTGASALNDVTQGNNPGCGTDGFTAASGWDPVTGLGTPDFKRLLNAIKNNITKT